MMVAEVHWRCLVSWQEQPVPDVAQQAALVVDPRRNLVQELSYSKRKRVLVLVRLRLKRLARESMAKLAGLRPPSWMIRPPVWVRCVALGLNHWRNINCWRHGIAVLLCQLGRYWPSWTGVIQQAIQVVCRNQLTARCGAFFARHSWR